MTGIFPTQIRKLCWFNFERFMNSQMHKTSLETDKPHMYESQEESKPSYEPQQREEEEGEIQVADHEAPALPLTRSRKRQHQPDQETYCDSAGVRRRIRKNWAPGQDQILVSEEPLEDEEEDNNDYVRVTRSGKSRLPTISKKSSSGVLTKSTTKTRSNPNSQSSVLTGGNNLKNKSREDQDFEPQEKMGAIKCSSNCDKSPAGNAGKSGGACTHFSPNHFNSLTSSSTHLCKCFLVSNNNGKKGEGDLSVALGGASGKKLKRVYDFAEAPSYLKFNPYITGGYRSALTPIECVKSLFWWTNETLNIWSHLIGWLFFLGLSIYDSLGLLNLPTTQPLDQIIITLLLVCFQACMLLSALYHVFCCCSEKFYRRWLSADLFGVSLSLLAIYISGIYYAFSCVPFWLNFYLITVGAIFASAMGGVAKSLIKKPTTEEAFHWRLVLFGGWAAYGIVPTFHWAVLHGGMSSPVVSLLLPRIFWMYGISIAAFIFYVFRLPEKLYPGSVNYIFSSHQLWHLLIVLALYWWHNTGLLYLQFRATNSCEAEYEFLFPSSTIPVPVES